MNSQVSRFPQNRMQKARALTSEISAAQRQSIAHHRDREIVTVRASEALAGACRRKDIAALTRPTLMGAYQSTPGMSHSENLKQTCLSAIAQKPRSAVVHETGVPAFGSSLIPGRYTTSASKQIRAMHVSYYSLAQSTEVTLDRKTPSRNCNGAAASVPISLKKRGCQRLQKRDRSQPVASEFTRFLTKPYSITRSCCPKSAPQATASGAVKKQLWCVSC